MNKRNCQDNPSVWKREQLQDNHTHWARSEYTVIVPSAFIIEQFLNYLMKLLQIVFYLDLKVKSISNYLIQFYSSFQRNKTYIDLKN